MDKKKQKRERAEKREQKKQASNQGQRDRARAKIFFGFIAFVCVGFFTIYNLSFDTETREYPIADQTEAVGRITMSDFRSSPGQWKLVTGPSSAEGYSKDSPSSETMAATLASEMSRMGVGEFAILQDEDGVWQVASRWALLDGLDSMTDD